MQLFDPIPDHYADVLNAGLNNHNAAAAITRSAFLIAEMNNQAKMIGGVSATVSLQALFVKHLWVDPTMRGRGLGAGLMQAAEAEGIRRGARQACVDTLSTQAPEFYARLGYIEFGRLGGLGPDNDLYRVWLKKPLA